MVIGDRLRRVQPPVSHEFAVVQDVKQDIKRVTTAFGDIGYVERGVGPAALFVHGVFLNNYLWRHMIDRLVDRRRCIALDLLAHGATGAAPEQELTFTAQAEMIEAFCGALRLDHRCPSGQGFKRLKSDGDREIVWTVSAGRYRLRRCPL